MDKNTARLVGSIYFALCQGLSDQGIALANDCLYSLADSSSPETATVLRMIADSSVNGADNHPKQQQFKLIPGGAA
jgi:hypothetical protein